MHGMCYVAGALLATLGQAGGGSSAIVLDDCIVTLIEDVDVAAESAGLLREIGAAEGDRVPQGHLLGRLHDVDAQLQKTAAELNYKIALEDSTNDINTRYARASADVAKAELEASEAVNLRQPRSIPRTEINRLRLAYKKADLQIEVADLEYMKAGLMAKVEQANVAAADDQIEKRRIDSPIEGEVEQVFKRVGEWLNPGDTLMRIVYMDEVRVQGLVPATDEEDYGDESQDTRSYESFAQAENSPFGQREKGILPAMVKGKDVLISVVDLPGDIPQELCTLRGRIGHVSNLVETSGDYRVWAQVVNRKIALRSGRWVEVDRADQAPDTFWVLRPGFTVNMTIPLVGN